MTYPHESLEQRVQLLEAAVARLTRDLGEVQRRPAAAPKAAGSVSMEDMDKWTQEWLLTINDRGRPVARMASPVECRKKGGGGKGDWDGDPTVKWDPKFWKKESWAGRTYSQCPPDYLDMVAEVEEYRAYSSLNDPEKKKYAKYSLRNAALAKGWAKMIREDPGVQRTAAPSVLDQDFEMPSDDEIPF